ncbi:hypothetical protein MKX03_006195, partial [Papaver bracteatum]
VAADTYMWKAIQKRDRPGQGLSLDSGFWCESSSSQQVSVNSTSYLRNWSLMQAYFHWDTPLPAPKKARITALDLNCPPTDQLIEEIKDVHVVEDTDKVVAFPYQWFKGESSHASTVITEDKSKGKEVVNLD